MQALGTLIGKFISQNHIVDCCDLSWPHLRILDLLFSHCKTKLSVLSPQRPPDGSITTQNILLAIFFIVYKLSYVYKLCLIQKDE